MRIAFLGTPEFALPPLEMLIQSGHELALFTQPDRPVGRHSRLVAPPAKQLAQQNGIPVFQFEKIRSAEGIEALSAFAPDLMVTAAFGQLLSQANLDIPRLGCINVHGSLLPKYRGAAPIQWAIVNGEAVTGVTTMMTDIGMDTGDILLMEETPILPDETTDELAKRLSVLGAALLKRTIEQLESGTLPRRPQDASRATKCVMLRKEHGKIDFGRPAKQVHDLVRGMNSWPGAFAFHGDVTVKIWRTRQSDECASSAAPGVCFGDPKRGLFVMCADAPLEILELQLPGGKRLDGKTFLRGNAFDGVCLR